MSLVSRNRSQSSNDPPPAPSRRRDRSESVKLRVIFTVAEQGTVCTARRRSGLRRRIVFPEDPTQRELKGPNHAVDIFLKLEGIKGEAR